MLDLSNNLETIRRICSELRVRTLAVTGSAVRPDFNPEKSDIDLLVVFEGQERLFDRYFELKSRLENSLKRPVDLIQPSALRNAKVKQNLERDRIPIYGT